MCSGLRGRHVARVLLLKCRFLSTFMYLKLSQVKMGILEALLFHPVICTQRATQVPKTVIVNSPIRDHRPKL